jgi:hypothetical protein
LHSAICQTATNVVHSRPLEMPSKFERLRKLGQFEGKFGSETVVLRTEVYSIRVLCCKLIQAYNSKPVEGRSQ